MAACHDCRDARSTPRPTTRGRCEAIERADRGTADREHRSIGKRANELNAAIRYTMWSVFKLARPLGDDQRAAAADEVAALIDELAGKDVVVRGVYDVAGPAGRRRPHGLVARRDPGGAAGGLHPAAPHRARPAPRPGVVADGAAPPGGVQPQPHPGVPGRRGAAPLRLRLPVRAVLRVVPAARRGAPVHARRAREDGPRLPRRAGQHRRLVRARRLRVDARLRGRRAAPHRRPDARAAGVRRRGGTCARRCRSTPASASRSPSWSTTCRSGRRTECRKPALLHCRSARRAAAGCSPS